MKKNKAENIVNNKEQNQLKQEKRKKNNSKPSQTNK
jgi:hypothetical protein